MIKMPSKKLNKFNEFEVECLICKKIYIQDRINPLSCPSCGAITAISYKRIKPVIWDFNIKSIITPSI